VKQCQSKKPAEALQPHLLEMFDGGPHAMHVLIDATIVQQTCTIINLKFIIFKKKDNEERLAASVVFSKRKEKLPLSTTSGQ
jgi:hypothetical protein